MRGQGCKKDVRGDGRVKVSDEMTPGQRAPLTGVILSGSASEHFPLHTLKGSSHGVGGVIFSKRSVRSPKQKSTKACSEQGV